MIIHRRTHGSLSSRVALVFAAALGGVVAGAQGCSMGQAASPTLPDAGVGSRPFEADPPSVYVAKVKNVLTGLSPTADEIQTVTADPTRLGSLVDGWMKLPQYEQKMRVFFGLAFQQTQITTADFAQMIPNPGGIGVGPLMTLLVQNARESFARTVLALIAEGRPLTEAFTTTRFMMTPPLMELYAFLDSNQVDDGQKVNDRLRNQSLTATISVGAASGPIALADSIDPSSPSYMRWYVPDFAKATAIAGCAADPRVYPRSSHVVHELLYGSLDLFKGTAGVACTPYSNPADAAFTVADFAAWKMVTVRPPRASEPLTRFFDVPLLRTASELVVSTPRVGYFTTPAFFANWQTNSSNRMRVTLNQSLIVATSMSIDGTDDTSPPSTPGLDAAHAAPGSSCFGCHQTLDPSRAILESTYSYGYGNQPSAPLAAQKGLFAFHGVIAPVASVNDFASVLATHPAFAQSWAQKLCYYVNSQPCEPADPELQRVVGVFAGSGYSWSALVRELVSSPLTTNAAPTQTTLDDGVTVAVSRRDHLCATLDARLGLTDVCGLDVVGGKGAAGGGPIPAIASGLPSDGYGRGAPIPILPNAPTLFFRAATENVCAAIAQQLVDPPGATPAGARRYASAQADAAIADLVQTLMALAPGDPRAAQAQAILQAHFTSATTGGASATDALRSTFIVACLSPSVVGMGM